MKILDIRKDFDPERVFITNVNGFTMSTFAIKDSPNHYMDNPKDYHIRFKDYNSLINLFKEKGFVEKIDYVAGYVSSGYILVNSLTSKMTHYLLYGKTDYPTPERVGEQEVYMDPKLNAMMSESQFKFIYNSEESGGNISRFELVGWNYDKYGRENDVLRPDAPNHSSVLTDIVNIMKQCGFTDDDYYTYTYTDCHSIELYARNIKTAEFIVDHLSNYHATVRDMIKQTIHAKVDNKSDQKLYTDPKLNAMISEGQFKFAYNAEDSDGKESCFKLVGWDTKYGPGLDLSILKPTEVDTAILDIVAILRHCGFGYDEYKFYVDDDVVELHTYTPKMAEFIIDNLSRYNTAARMELEKRVRSEFNKNKMKAAEKFEKSLRFMYDHIDISGNNFRVYFVLTKWDTSEYGSVIDDCDYYVVCDNLRTIMNSNDMRESIHYNIEYHNNCIYLIAVNNDKSIDFIIDHLCINTDKEELKNKIYNKLKGYFSPDYQKDHKEVKPMEDEIDDEKPKSTVPSIMDTIRIIKDKIDKDKKMEEDMHDAVDVISPEKEVKPTMDPHVKRIKDEIEYQIKAVHSIFEFIGNEIDRMSAQSDYDAQYNTQCASNPSVLMDYMKVNLKDIIGAEHTAIDMLNRLIHIGCKLYQ